MQTLSGKTAVVTGAASGIGLALAEVFVSSGMKVALADIQGRALEQAVDSLRANGAEATGVVTDVSQFTDLQRLADHAFATFGGVHILCNNAGVGGAIGPSWSQSANDWNWVIDINLMGVVHGIRAFVPRMLDQKTKCHIVNTASAVAFLPTPMAAPYSVAKHGILALSEALALEFQLLRAPIGVSVVCPAAVATNIVDSEQLRPASLRNPSSISAPQRAAVEQVRKAIAAGMAPAQVAERVLDAIHSNRFYVLTHPGTDRLIEDWCQRVVRGDAPQSPNWE